MKLTKEIIIYPAFDKRSSIPSQNFGIHSVEILFLLKGDEGVVEFLLFTNWHLPEVQKEIDGRPIDPRFPFLFHKPQPADLGYHSRVPMYEDHPGRADCPFLDGATCYYDGSGLAAEAAFNTMCEKGSEGLWEFLEEYYQDTFR